MKKAIGIFISMVMLVTVVSGCGKVKDTEVSAAGKKTVTITRRLAGWGARDANFTEGLKRLNKELEGENVEVVIEEWPKVGDEELALQAQAGKKADIFINSSVDIGWQLEAGLIKEIDWVKDSELFKTTPENLMNIMYFDGHYYGVLQDMDVSPVFLNRATLKALGMNDSEINGLKEKVNKGEFVLNDLVNLGKKAKDQGLVELGFAVEDKRFEGWEYAFGAYNYDLKQNKLVFDKKAAKEVFGFWEDAFKKGVINESIGDIGTDLSAPKFVEGKIFASFARTEYYSELCAAKGMEKDQAGFDKWFNDNVVAIPIPNAKQGGKPVSFSNPGMIYVGADVDEKKMPYVQRLVELMMSPDLQINHTLLSGKLPVTPEAYADERFQKMDYYKNLVYLTEMTAVRPPLSYYSRFVEGYTMGIDTILVGKKDANAAFDAYLADTKQYIPEEFIIYK